MAQLKCNIQDIKQMWRESWLSLALTPLQLCGLPQSHDTVVKTAGSCQSINQFLWKMSSNECSYRQSWKSTHQTDFTCRTMEPDGGKWDCFAIHSFSCDTAFHSFVCHTWLNERACVLTGALNTLGFICRIWRNEEKRGNETATGAEAGFLKPKCWRTQKWFTFEKNCIILLIENIERRRVSTTFGMKERQRAYQSSVWSQLCCWVWLQLCKREDRRETSKQRCVGTAGRGLTMVCIYVG